MYQYKKLGTVLLNALLKNCAKLNKSLSLIPANEFVHAWYRRHGFYISNYFKASDGTLWPSMNFHTKNTRSQDKMLHND